MSEVAHLSVDSVLATHECVLAAHGGGSGLRDIALLESAVAAPQAFFRGEDVMSDPIEIAASYLFYLCNNHPFVDGNKRTALAACLVFLEQNELYDAGSLDVDVWEGFVLSVAKSQLDRAGTTERLRELIVL